LKTTITYSLIFFTLFFIACHEQSSVNTSNLAGKRPNILFVISDDQSYPHASAYGYQSIQTPAFDRIAREGVLFSQAFAASPGCSPSRAALLTGLNCWQIEEAGTHASSFPQEYIVFPDLLEQAGYYIGYTGKGWGPGDHEASGRIRNPAGVAFSGNTLESPEGISDINYAANFEDFLAGHPQDQPFFFWLGSYEPHRSYKQGIGKEAGMAMEEVAVPSFLPDVEEVRSDLLDYGYEIQWFDAQLGKAIELLERAGELDNTLIVVTSDNGMPFPRAKANVYEYGIHVPLAVRWGNEIRGGRKVDDLVSLMDFCATFLEVANAEFPSYPLESKSLLNILASQQQGIVDSSRTSVYASRERHSSSRWNNLGYPQRCIRTDQYLYIRNFKPERWPAGSPQKYDEKGNPEQPPTAYHDIDEASDNFVIRERDSPQYSKYFHWAVDKRPAEELYDIQKDPGCLNNLAGIVDHAEELLLLRTALGGYLMRTQDPRVIGNGEVFETYPRLRGPVRQFTEPALTFNLTNKQ
jgi:N-sulfoglucosamine sulfohydrolase